MKKKKKKNLKHLMANLFKNQILMRHLSKFKLFVVLRWNWNSLPNKLKRHEISPNSKCLHPDLGDINTHHISQNVHIYMYFFFIPNCICWISNDRAAVQSQYVGSPSVNNLPHLFDIILLSTTFLVAKKKKIINNVFFSY